MGISKHEDLRYTYVFWAPYWLISTHTHICVRAAIVSAVKKVPSRSEGNVSSCRRSDLKKANTKWYGS